MQTETPHGQNRIYRIVADMRDKSQCPAAKAQDGKRLRFDQRSETMQGLARACALRHGCTCRLMTTYEYELSIDKKAR